VLLNIDMRNKKSRQLKTQYLKISYLRIGINVIVEEGKLIKGRKRDNNPIFANDVVQII
jgi:hypothetical protein